MKNINFLTFISVLCFSGTAATAQFLGGTGTSENPWQIASVAELDSVRNYPDSNFVLLNDLDFSLSKYDSTKSDTVWVPIYSFAGSFNGKGHSISNVFINRPSKHNQYLKGIFYGSCVFFEASCSCQDEYS
jgi:hypothetical protein